MEIVHPLKDLLDELSSFLFTQRLLLGQEVKQLATRHPETQTVINIQLPAAVKSEEAAFTNIISYTQDMSTRLEVDSGNPPTTERIQVRGRVWPLFIWF